MRGCACACIHAFVCVRACVRKRLSSFRFELLCRPLHQAILAADKVRVTVVLLKKPLRHKDAAQGKRRCPDTEALFLEVRWIAACLVVIELVERATELLECSDRVAEVRHEQIRLVRFKHACVHACAHLHAYFAKVCGLAHTCSQCGLLLLDQWQKGLGDYAPRPHP